MPNSVGEASLVEYLQKAYAKDLTKVHTFCINWSFSSNPFIIWLFLCFRSERLCLRSLWEEVWQNKSQQKPLPPLFSRDCLSCDLIRRQTFARNSIKELYRPTLVLMDSLLANHSIIWWRNWIKSAKSIVTALTTFARSILSYLCASLPAGWQRWGFRFWQERPIWGVFDCYHDTPIDPWTPLKTSKS